MKKRDVLILSLAITALYHIYSVISHYALFRVLIQGISTNSLFHVDRIGKWIVALLPSGLMLLISAILWIYAGRIADYILNKTRTPESAERLTLAESLMLAVVITGFFLVLSALRTMPLSSLSYLFMDSLPTKPVIPSVSTVIRDSSVSVIKILIGLLFIFSPKRIVSLLTNRITES